jgi:hypothetical protein
MKIKIKDVEIELGVHPLWLVSIICGAIFVIVVLSPV